MCAAVEDLYSSLSPCLSCFPFISPFFTHMYTKPQITLKKAEEEEKLTQSLEIEFKVSFANWVADARKIQWKEEKVCACVTVCNCACVCECVCECRA